ncbi:alpha-N-acetylneuraminide alpha-2,8-sialyltransferase-like isoform X3 [Ptychodera flava]
MSCKFIFRRRRQLCCFVIAMLLVYFTLALFMGEQKSHITVKKRHHHRHHRKVPRILGNVNGTVKGAVNGTKSHKGGKIKPPIRRKKPNIMESVLNNGTIDVLKVFKSIHQNWTFNATAAEEFRLLTENGCNTSETFLVTKRTVKINDTLPYEAEKDRQWNVTSNVLNRIPRESPYKWTSFKKCSIVGSSGILLGSKCGKQIDSSDFVVRFNFAKIRNFEEDVGSKTSLMTCNPSVFEKNYYGLAENMTEQFRKDVLTEYGNTTIYIPAFCNSLGNQLSFRAQDVLNSTSVRILFPNPLHMISVKSFWKLRGVGGLHLSSGLLLFTTFLSLCQEIHLYGYWPFIEDAYGTPVYYHYFDSPDTVHRLARLQGRYHNMPAELMSMINLHNRGIIRLHYGQC